MWIEDLTKALYFLNASDSRRCLLINRIVNNVIYFTNDTAITVEDAAKAYNVYIKYGELKPISTLLR